MSNNSLGLQLTVARIIAQKSQGELAFEVGISQQWLCDIEKGKGTPSSQLEQRLKEAVNWTPQIEALFLSWDLPNGHSDSPDGTVPTAPAPAGQANA